jgi:hypothetical protein
MWLTDEQVRARSSGEVRKPESYNYRTFLPEKGGLYCPTIFGPVSWSAMEHHIDQDVRRDRYGHIELPCPIARRDGPARQVILVVPPMYRQFRAMSANEAFATARTRRARLIELDASGQWPYSDPLDKLLAEEGLEEDPVLGVDGAQTIEPTLNVAYRTVVNLAHMVRRLSELSAPEHVIEEQRVRLAVACVRVDAEIPQAALPEELRKLALGLA